MTRNKLKHFAEMKNWSHVYEPSFEDHLDLKGKWGEKVVLELACGGGYYTLALAKRLPDTTLVGVDIKGSRLWHGAEKALDEKLENAHFLRGRIEDLEQYFAAAEVDDIWVTFPDPHPREGKEKKRLTSPRFLKIYAALLKPNGRLNLKTDDLALFEYSLETVKSEGWKVVDERRDLHNDPDSPALLTEIKTHYEQRFMAEGKPIYFMSCQR